METFRNVHLLAHDMSDTMSAAEVKAKLFFGGSDNICVVWDYCILSKLQGEKSSEELHESNAMHLELLLNLFSFL